MEKSIAFLDEFHLHKTSARRSIRELENVTRFGNQLFFLAWGGMLLYAAYASGAKGDWFFVTWCAVIASIPVYGMISSLARSRAMRRFAAERGITFLSSSLPPNLLLARTSFAPRAYSASNCMVGYFGQVYLAVADVTYSHGKGSRSQTVVAFRSRGSGAVADVPIDVVGSYEFEAAGDWIIAHIPGRTVSTDELNDWCVDLHTLAIDLLAEADGTSAPRPHLFRWLS